MLYFSPLSSLSLSLSLSLMYTTYWKEWNDDFIDDRNKRYHHCYHYACSERSIGEPCTITKIARSITSLLLIKVYV